MPLIASHDKRMELTEHLGELRSHIIRAIWYLILGAVIAYQYFGPLYGFLYRPLQKEINRLNTVQIQKLIKLQIAEAPAALRPYIEKGPHAEHDPPNKVDFD